MTDPDNLVLVHLRELPSELAQFREEVRAQFKQMDSRLDAMHANGLRALQQFVGHRAMTTRTVASIEQQLAMLEQRVERLEAARG